MALEIAVLKKRNARGQSSRASMDTEGEARCTCYEATEDIQFGLRAQVFFSPRAWTMVGPRPSFASDVVIG